MFAVVAVGSALSGSVPKRATSLALSQFGYLLSLAMIIGIANWTTFVFGLVAFKTLPRQTFGLLQAKLFPKYFQVCLGVCRTVSHLLQQERHTCNRNGPHVTSHCTQATVWCATQVLTLFLGIALLTFTSVRGQKLNAQLWALLIALACNVANMMVVGEACKLAYVS